MVRDNAYEELGDKSLQALFSESHQHAVVLLLVVDWSGASHIMDTYMEDLSEKYGKDFQFYWQDVEKFDKLGKRLEVENLPYTFIFKDGEIVDSFQGILSIRKIETRLESVL